MLRRSPKFAVATVLVPTNLTNDERAAILAHAGNDSLFLVTAKSPAGALSNSLVARWYLRKATGSGSAKLVLMTTPTRDRSGLTRLAKRSGIKLETWHLDAGKIHVGAPWVPFWPEQNWSAAWKAAFTLCPAPRPSRVPVRVPVRDDRES